MSGKFVQCPECEASFHEKYVTNGRLPQHSFCGKPCLAGPEDWTEYDAAAMWCAKHGHSGEAGTPLPELISARTVAQINDDIDAFVERVKASAYALAMEGHPEE